MYDEGRRRGGHKTRWRELHQINPFLPAHAKDNVRARLYTREEKTRLEWHWRFVARKTENVLN